jgi:hypothetical protein
MVTMFQENVNQDASNQNASAGTSACVAIRYGLDYPGVKSQCR